MYGERRVHELRANAEVPVLRGKVPLDRNNRALLGAALALLEAVHAVREHALDDRLHGGRRLAAACVDALDHRLLQPRQNAVHALCGGWRISPCTFCRSARYL